MEAVDSSGVGIKKENHLKEEKAFKTKMVLIGSIVLAVFCLALLIVWFVTWKVTASGSPEPQRLKAEKTNSSKPFSGNTSTATNPITNLTTTPPKKVCKTPACIALSYKLFSFGNKSVDPCVNFYEHACGRFSEHGISSSVPVWKTEIVHEAIADYVHRNKNAKTNSTSETILKQMFLLCEKEKIKKEQDISFYREVLADIKKVGIWPMIDPSFDESAFNMTQYLENMLVKIGLISFGIYSLDLHDVDVALKWDNRVNKGQETYDLEEFQKFARVANIQTDQKTIDSDMTEYARLQDRLGALRTATWHDGYGWAYHSDFEDLYSKNPLLNLESLINYFKSPNRPKITEFFNNHFTSWGTNMFVTSGNISLHQLILDTSPRSLANIFTFRVFQNALDVVTIKDSCAAFVAKKMPKDSLRIYMRNYFKKESRKLGAELANKMIQAYMKMFESSTWLHESTKKMNLRDVNLTRIVVGYSEELEESGDIDQIYDEFIDVSPSDSFYVLNRKMQSFIRKTHVHDLALGLYIPELAPLEFTAYFTPGQRLFVLPFRHLESPSFDASLPDVARIAIVGDTIGHKMRKFSNAQDFDNWDEKDREEYNKRIKCWTEQYVDYGVSSGRTLDGETTLDENYSDHLGITTAWSAYKELKDEKEDISIVGFEDYPPDKLFFHARALKHCNTNNAREQQISEGYSVSDFRVNGVLANMEEFAETFQCPVGSPMNPEKKCKMF
uniref:Uncharacterized protein n=1 Tax=Caenorhabditis japonica TaxID=281687 RepID=A0A8R1DGI6_CAEJA